MTGYRIVPAPPRPSLGDDELERRAWYEGRQVVVCYGGEKGRKHAEYLKKSNPLDYIEFIVASASLPLGKPTPEDGVLVTGQKMEGRMIKEIKREFGVDLSKIQYAVWDGSDDFLPRLYDNIRKIVILV